MDTNDRFLLKAQNAIRFSPEEIEEMTGEIQNIFPEYNQFTTFKRVFTDLFTRATAIYRKTTESKPADLEEIQNLKNEIGRLKIAADLQGDEIAKLENALIQAVEAQGARGADQILLTLPPEIFAFLAKECQEAGANARREVSNNEIINVHCWNMYRNGVTRPFYIWDAAERAKIQKQQKALENVGNPQ